MKFEYPFKVFVLTPAMLVKSVELVRSYRRWDGSECHETKSGKLYSQDQVYLNAAEAISAGREHLAKQRADLDKKLANLQKREANLAKAEAKL